MKVAITGAGGGVGSSVAFNLLLLDSGYELLLIDSRPEMLESHAMDLEQVLEQRPSGSLRRARYEDLAGAEVIVATAAAPLTVNSTRNVYLERNAAILGEMLAHVPAGWRGILLLVANPVDPLCTWVHARAQLPRDRLLGYTFNDSLRLRSGIATALGAAAGEVDAWVLGEHGDHGVPLFERVGLAGESCRLRAEQRDAAQRFLRDWYKRHVALDSGRSSTWTSGLGIARMVEAIHSDSGELWPASIVLEGEYGIDGVSLGVPVELWREGARIAPEWELTAAEGTALQAGADAVAAAAASLQAAAG